MAYFSVYPTCDIHLILNGASFELEVNDDFLNNLSLSPGTSWSGFDSSIVNISPSADKIQFTPNDIGSTIGWISNTDGDTTYHHLVRVSVHQSIQQFWFGNNQITIHEAATNYVVCVYAQFEDDSVGDISGHPYLNFQINTPLPLGDALSINNTNDKGRLTGVRNTNGQSIEVQLDMLGLAPQSLNVKVREPLSAPRPIIEPIRLNGPFLEKRNILVLPEGFLDTPEDKAIFNRAVRELDKQFFDTNQNSPFDILKNSFNLWKAFIPSPEAGVTIASPIMENGQAIPSVLPDNISDRKCNANFYSGGKLIEFVGLPDDSTSNNLSANLNTWVASYGSEGFDPTKVDQEMFDYWFQQRQYSYAQAKDSFFGIAFGGRYGYRFASETKEKKNAFYLPNLPPRGLLPDLYRREKNRNIQLFILEFLSSLRLKSGNTSDPNSNVSSIWATHDENRDFSFGRDLPLICMLVKSSRFGGTNINPFFISLGAHTEHPLTITNGSPIVDHSPDLSFQNGHPNQIDMTVKSVEIAHEYGHSLRLGDEYEAYDDPKKSVLLNQESEINFIETVWNLTHFFAMKKRDSNELDAQKIPWNWHRVTKVATSIRPAFNQDETQIVIRMQPGEGKNWLKEKNDNTQIFLRHPEMNRDPNDRTRRIEGPLTIHSITPNSMGDVFVLDGRTRQITGNNPYPPGSLLFVPLRDKAGNILTCVDPAVINYINSNAGQGKPFVAKSDCSSCSNVPGFPPPNIPGLNYPTNHFQLIGLYEGGGFYNCRVYRPNGSSRMRTTRAIDFTGGIQRTQHFSFISQYIMVNIIDPTKLPLINPAYPK